MEDSTLWTFNMAERCPLSRLASVNLNVYKSADHISNPNCSSPVQSTRNLIHNTKAKTFGWPDTDMGFLDRTFPLDFRPL